MPPPIAATVGVNDHNAAPYGMNDLYRPFRAYPEAIRTKAAPFILTDREVELVGGVDSNYPAIEA